MVRQLFVGLLISSLPAVHGAFYNSPDEVPSFDNIDYIVVGAGTAGSVVANRLTEDDVNVLVIEAGPSNEGVLNSIVPDYCSRMGAAGNTLQYDWNFTTIPQPSLNNREIPFARGHIVGGSSSVNCMIYTRGSSDDYDKMAAVTGEEAWTWDNLVPYMQRGESFSAPVDGRDYSLEWVPEAHGTEGPLHVVPRNYIHALDQYVIDSGNEMGGDLTYNPDMNTGTPLGLGFTQSAIHNGSRDSAGTAYLQAEEFIGRQNLNILLNSQVTRLYPTGDDTFKTVEFTPDAGESWFNVTANRAVILSAGPVGTPRILMYSGIGESDLLSSVGIETLHDLPSVGKNITEQPGCRLEFLVNSTDTEDTINRNQTLDAQLLAQWNETRTGVYSMGPLNPIAWLRLPEDAPVEDPSSGPGAPHYELFAWYGIPYQAEEPAEGNYMTLGTVVLNPLSNGSVSINSSDPLAQPVLDLNMLSSEWEIYTMRESLKMVQRWAKAEAWDGLILSPVQNFTTDEELDEWARQESRMANHPCGGAQMSAEDATYGVVNPNLAVKGLNDLWVIDSSVFPYTPAAHTMAPTYIIAERGVDFVKEAYGGSA